MPCPRVLQAYGTTGYQTQSITQMWQCQPSSHSVAERQTFALERQWPNGKEFLYHVLKNNLLKGYKLDRYFFSTSSIRSYSQRFYKSASKSEFKFENDLVLVLSSNRLGLFMKKITLAAQLANFYSDNNRKVASHCGKYCTCTQRIHQCACQTELFYLRVSL